MMNLKSFKNSCGDTKSGAQRSKQRYDAIQSPAFTKFINWLKVNENQSVPKL